MGSGVVVEATKSVSLIAIQGVPLVLVGVSEGCLLLDVMAFQIVLGKKSVDPFLGADVLLGTRIELIIASTIANGGLALETLRPLLIGDVPFPETFAVLVIVDAMKAVMGDRALGLSGLAKKLWGGGVGVGGELGGKKM